MTNEQQALAQNCTLWAIRTSGWAATDGISAEDIDKREEDVPDIFRLGRKYLIPDEWRVKLNRPRNKISGFMETVGKRYIVSSIWAVPNKYLEFVDSWFKKLKEEQAAIVEEFLAEYDAIKETMVSKYSVLDTATWPSPDKVKKLFRIQTFVFEIGNVKLNKVDPDNLIAIKKKYAAELDKSVKEITDLYVAQAHQNIIDNCRDLTMRITQDGKKITKTTLKKPLDLIRKYEDVVCMFDVGNSSDIKAEIEKLKQTVSNVTAGQIREKGVIAEEFASAVSAIGKNIGDLSGFDADGRAKRVLVFEKAA